MQYLIGQGYDGAAAMGGHLNGVRTAIQEQYPMALYVHCSAHSLNLALSKACTVPVIRNSLGTVNEIIKFFKSSAQRLELLKQKISQDMPTTNHSHLISMCETRWVERHKSIYRFVEMYQPIVHALEELECGARQETSKQAHQFLSVITRGSFVLALVVAEKCFSHTLPLCTALQKVDCDIAESCKFVTCVLEVFQEMRLNAESTFDVLFCTAQNIISSVNGETIAVPRITGRQANRVNVPAANTSEYYRLSLFIPFVDYLINELKQRFTAHASILASLQIFLPQHCCNCQLKEDPETEEQIRKCSEFYYNMLPDPQHLAPEMEVWQKKWQMVSDGDRPLSALDSFMSCNGEFFPNIQVLLRILATLPVSTATAERSFSTLKRLKSYLRNSIGESRLSGLALMSIHREIDIVPETVLDRFAKAPRRYKLLV